MEHRPDRHEAEMERLRAQFEIPLYNHVQGKAHDPDEEEYNTYGEGEDEYGGNGTVKPYDEFDSAYNGTVQDPTFIPQTLKGKQREQYKQRVQPVTDSFVPQTLTEEQKAL